MDDSEFIELKSRFIFGILICIIFLVPIFIFFYNRLINQGKVMHKIHNKDSFILLVTDNKCDQCSRYKTLLKSRNIDYVVSNRNKDIKYNDYLKKLEISKTTIKIPAVIYIEEGKLHSFLSGVESEENIINYLDNLKSGEL